MLAKARERVLEAQLNGELAKRGWEPVADPVEAYADLTGEVWAFKELCRDQLRVLGRWTTTNKLTGSDEVCALVAVYERALERSQKTLGDMLRIGLTAEHLRQARERPAKEQAAVFVRVLDAVLDALDLTAQQRAQLPGALSAALTKEGLL